MLELEPHVRDHLAAPGRYATVATIEPDGSPLQAAVWYALEDDATLLLNSLEGRRWPANLRRDPRASVVVASGSTYVALRGTAEFLYGGDAASRDIERLAHLYEQGDALERMIAVFDGQRRVSFRFHPRSAHFHP